MVGATKPGSKATVQVWRNKQARDLQVVVVEMQDDRAARQSRGGSKPPATPQSAYGLTLSELTDTQRAELKVAGGVLVENAQGAAARAGVRRGDVILAINNQDVKSVEQFNQGSSTRAVSSHFWFAGAPIRSISRSGLMETKWILSGN
jgi:serine protease Do